MKILKSKFGFWLALIVFLLIVLLGIGLMVYPLIAARYAESVRSEIQTSYEEIIQEVDTFEMDAIRDSAMAYNKDLANKVFTPLDYEERGYYDLMVLPDTDVMCYISIPKIDVYLPVYHGVGTSSLDKGAGHMEQSSLPVGGPSTHAVISAHSGMAQSPMFSDLELLEIGDIFQIYVLNEVLTYEVENIEVVLPQMVNFTSVVMYEDLVSLVTCTPYGINTHRLIVRGHRIPTPVEEDTKEPIQLQNSSKNKESVWMQQYWHSVKMGAMIAITVLLVVLIVFFAIKLAGLLRVRGKYERKRK